MTTPTNPMPALSGRVPLADMTAEALAVSLAGASLKSDASKSALRDAVCEFVGARKTQGLKPEQVVVELKTIVRAATPRRPDVGSPEERESAMVMQQSLEWCIAEYYRTD